MSDNTTSVIILLALCLVPFTLGFLVARRLALRKVGSAKSIRAEHQKLNDAITNLKSQLQSLLALTETTQKISDDGENTDKLVVAIRQAIQDKKEEYQKVDTATKKLQELEKNSDKIKQDYELLATKQLELDSLKSELSLYADMDYYVEHGLYPLPQYGDVSSGAYNEQLKSIRSEQKEMIRKQVAYHYPENIRITGNKSYDKRLVKNQGNLLITAFNCEADYLISKINSRNYEATLTKVEKIAETLEKKLISLEIGIALPYIELKMKECTIYYQYVCQKAAEADEQREIRAQIREEAAAQREIERAIQQAEKEEKAIQSALAKARAEMAAATAEQKHQYESQLKTLEEKLAEAEARGERALSMAQQTKRGHVYIISNIGSFGEDVFKIGMTRRLEPFDRVKELGDASVPFPFDVHAMIFSEDAPKLEKELHHHFELASVNKVNNRKEFFELTLKEIRDYLEGQSIDVRWTMIAEATEYRQSLVILEQQTKSVA